MKINCLSAQKIIQEFSHILMQLFRVENIYDFRNLIFDVFLSRL